MKIIYLVFLGSKLSGVTKKVISQYKSIKDLGIDLHLHFIAREKPNKDLVSYSHGSKDISFNYPNIKLNGLSLKKWKFEKALEILHKDRNEKKVLYIRDPGSDLFFYQFVKRIKKSNNKIVVEYQDLKSNFKHRIKNKYFFINDFIYRKRIVKSLDGAVVVTPTIKENIEGMNRTLPILVNPNGINIKDEKTRKIPNYENKELRMLFVGSLYEPQGLDRIIKGISIYNKKQSENKPKIKLYIAGNKSKKYINLVKKLKLENNVFFTGYKMGKELDELFDMSHIAIGVMAIHRKGDGSALKNREYTARGIPFIDSTNDIDFPGNWKYRLKIESNEKPINMFSIINFTDKIMRDKEHNVKMREYAKNNLDWTLKCKELVSFLNNEVCVDRGD